MSLFSGHAKTWLGAPLHSSVLSYPSQAEHPRPTKRLSHMLTQLCNGRAEKKGIKLERGEDRRQEETTVEEEESE